MRKEYKSFYKTVEGNEGTLCHYPTRLDTYGCGCQHNCEYCYARSLLDFRGLWDAENPAAADIEKIRRRLEKVPAGSVIRLGGMTDCFMPMEKQERVTYQTIQEMNRRGIHYLIVTKSAIVADAEYRALYDPELAHVQVTVTTLDDAFYLKRKYEKASLPSDRIFAIKKLQDDGLDVAIRLSPLICRLYVPSALDTADPAIQRLLTMSLRITAASAVMFFISNYADVWLFAKIKEKTKGKYLWLRNNVATIICNCLENFLFYILAFAGTFTIGQIVTMGLATCLLEIVIGLCDTPFLYLARKLKHGDEQDAA